MGEDSGEKTEEPTPHKIREARKKGQIAKSQEITTALMLVISFYAFKFLGERILVDLYNHTFFVFNLLNAPFSINLVSMLLLEAVKAILFTILPLLGIIVLAVLVIENLQTGFLFASEALTPKFENLNPMNGFKKFFSLKQYVELLKSIVKIIIISVILYFSIKHSLPLIIKSLSLGAMSLIGIVGKIVIETVTKVSIAYLFIGFLDYFYQKYEYMKSLKMSKKEIKEEYKRLEGDPLVKQRQREAQYAMSQSRQMGAVPGADVVVTNPIHFAVAIHYDSTKTTIPMVIAKGQRRIAHQIITIANDHNVPVIENPPIARYLFRKVDVGHYIPQESFQVIAEILAFVYHAKKKHDQRFDEQSSKVVD